MYLTMVISILTALTLHLGRQNTDCISNTPLVGNVPNPMISILSASSLHLGYRNTDCMPSDAVLQPDCFTTMLLLSHQMTE